MERIGRKIYVAIGQKRSTVAQLVWTLEENNATKYPTIAAATTEAVAYRQTTLLLHRLSIVRLTLVMSSTFTLVSSSVPPW